MTYIVAQSADGLYLVDQHASHERVVFERLMAQFRQGDFHIQNYLIPLVLDLTAAEPEAVMAAQVQFESMGLTVESMGPEQIGVTAAPDLISESGVAKALRSLAREITEWGGSFAWEKKMADIFASMACHSVVRAGQALSREQMQELLMQMDEFPLSSFCPHGRPVFIFQKFQDIERQFGRIV